ncbi:MAG TPA: FAD-dependent oxidoreductase [Chlamydiales bacterium]|nr:FAD-dependent oxidoreductase [Chlamydiales bacterium]
MKHILNILFAAILPVMPMTAAQPAEVEPVVILGGGVGSLTSAIYLGRAGVSPLVIEGPLPGGLLTQSHSVQNWPGEMEIDGSALTEKMRKQAEANGARFLNEKVIKVDFSKRPFTITTASLDGAETTHKITAESCIIAMGTKPNFLGIPGEQEYWGKGVTNCAVCDGSLYKDKIVGVVGGGDAAVLEALYLSNIAKEVHVFVRKDSLRAIEEKRVAVLKEKPNVKFIYNTNVQEVKGDQEGVTSVVLKTGTAKPHIFKLDGLFLAIGSTPNSALFKDNLKLDTKGYIALQKDQQTSVNGVYAIGDIVDPVYKQAVSAAGDGAKAALQAQQYLSDRANNIIVKKAPPPKKVVVNQAVKASAGVIEVSSSEQFQSEVDASETPVVVDFYATWCGPCKRVMPKIESSANQLVGKVKFLKVNVDKVAGLSQTYNIKAMPTMVLLNSSGTEIDRKVGLEEIITLLDQLESQN